ncbi:MAG: hypothetical protein Q7R66_07825 [Undibacterium sp.]|uniref:hypothetical protein n=1 Tax=Undibacterium sp. TaxID=1914977 RepID=UPI002727BD88|nr:hypothetical protein [Undibacterium sp.]MDO8652082.1 hypothetical protein [Undibacterium sp.]
MNPTNDLRASTASKAPAQSLAVSAPSAQSGSTSMRVVHPSSHKRVDQCALKRWTLSEKGLPFSKLGENLVPVSLGYALQLMTQRIKQAQYVFGIDGRWQLTGAVGFHGSSF